MQKRIEIRAELADLYIAKFPKLGLAENKAALTVLVDEKFEQIKWTILEDEEMFRQAAFQKQDHWIRAVTFLQSLGALPPDHGRRSDDDVPF
jgi:hypothetical protein